MRINFLHCGSINIEKKSSGVLIANLAMQAINYSSVTSKKSRCKPSHWAQPRSYSQIFLGELGEARERLSRLLFQV